MDSPEERLLIDANSLMLKSRGFYLTIVDNNGEVQHLFSAVGLNKVESIGLMHSAIGYADHFCSIDGYESVKDYEDPESGE